jgi:RimJ/RimL family protein N-acetyltransferase
MKTGALQEFNGKGRKEKSTMLLQTARIFLREFTYDDFDSLFEILSDPEVMKYYPKPFDFDRVNGWIECGLRELVIIDT